MWFYRFSTGKSVHIGRINEPAGNGLSVAPDGQWLLVAAAEWRSDLQMVENFR